MSWSLYSELKVQPQDHEGIKEKYSVTSDILSFQLCRRQYGFFAIRKYQPAHVVQMWYGTIIHQVLDKLHMHYLGLLNPDVKNIIPTDDYVKRYFEEVEDSLRARGIRAINNQIRDTAIAALLEFNRKEGPNLYPNVIDSECNLQISNQDYILHGVVDVLKNSSENIDTSIYDPVEIWDYKGSRFPNKNNKTDRKKLNDYEFQMLVYGELYKIKKGKYPAKGVLYFINELTNPKSINQVHVIDFTRPYNIERIKQAMKSFSETVRNIEDCKKNDRWDPPDEDKLPGDETCDICDLRWSCPSRRNHYTMRSYTSK